MSVWDRTWVFDVLVNTPEISSRVGNRIYSSFTMGTEPDAPVPVRPFLIYHAGDTLPEPTGVKVSRNPYTFYVHDEEGSYITNIEPLLAIIRKALESRAPEFWQGKQIFSADWQGDSGDLGDDVYRTSMRYSRIEVVVNS